MHRPALQHASKLVMHAAILLWSMIYENHYYKVFQRLIFSVYAQIGDIKIVVISCRRDGVGHDFFSGGYFFT